MIYYFNSNDCASIGAMYHRLAELLERDNAFMQPLVIMCIGSDRSTGDSLGPIIGYKLQRFTYKNVHIYGSLQEPVNAGNLASAIKNIHKTYHNPYIIAIDASLGQPEHIGYVTLGTGALKPGLGVKKELPEVGDLHITGIVNTMNEMNSILLQTTRLSSIMAIADFITTVLINTLCSNSRVNVYPYMLQVPDRLYQQHLSSYMNTSPEAYPG